MLALAGFGLVWAATSRYGPGISSDGAFYLASADNFALGKGFFDMSGDPLVFWPPLYPFALGVLRWATGVEPIVSGRVINALTVSALMACTAWLFRTCFPQRKIWFYLGTLATFLALFLYSIGANIATDLLFLLLVAVFLLLAQRLLARPTVALLVGISLVSAMAAMLRWIGLAFIVSQLILIVLAYGRQYKRGLVTALLFSGLAALPFLIWTVGRNYVQFGTLFGSQEMTYVSIVDNLIFTYVKMVKWFVPNSLSKRLPDGLLWLGVAVILLLFNRKTDWLRWLKAWGKPVFLPLPIFSLIYLVSITFTVYTADHPISDFYDDRYQTPLFFITLVGLFLSLDELVLSHVSPRRRRTADLIIAVIFGVWCLYPAAILYRFVDRSLTKGVAATYNIYNTGKLNKSELVEFIRSYPFEAGIPIYTNYNEAVYLFSGLATQPSPRDFENYFAQDGYLVEHYQGWPAEEAVYLIWFDSSSKRNYYSPDQMSLVSKIELIYSGEDGAVAIARPRE